MSWMAHYLVSKSPPCCPQNASLAALPKCNKLSPFGRLPYLTSTKAIEFKQIYPKKAPLSSSGSLQLCFSYFCSSHPVQRPQWRQPQQWWNQLRKPDFYPSYLVVNVTYECPLWTRARPSIIRRPVLLPSLPLSFPFGPKWSFGIPRWHSASTLPLPLTPLSWIS